MLPAEEVQIPVETAESKAEKTDEEISDCLLIVVIEKQKKVPGKPIRSIKNELEEKFNFGLKKVRI